MQIRKQMRFTGDVQGVGFRFRAYHAAMQLGLTGWVRNEYDGSVTLEAQGDPAAVEALPRLLEGSLYIRIDSVDTRTLPLRGDERTFEIRDE